ncbi:hypothetical protein MMC14_009507 [Varicellaria rhodocarpa]|nr:hypothetical protein [Varicellaria rhodocarpa]
MPQENRNPLENQEENRLDGSESPRNYSVRWGIVETPPPGRTAHMANRRAVPPTFTFRPRRVSPQRDVQGESSISTRQTSSASLANRWAVPSALTLRSQPDLPQQDVQGESSSSTQQTSPASSNSSDILKSSEPLWTTREDKDLQQAINNSIQDNQTPSNTGNDIGQTESVKRKDCNPSSSTMSESETPQKRSRTWSKPKPNLDTMIENVEGIYRFSLPLLRDPAADTYVFISTPPRQPEHDESTYESICERYSKPCCVRKDVMDSLNSPRINELFGPTAQFRVIRRHGLVNKLPSHIKYVIDLSPPTEGDEATELVTEAYCSPTIREWYKSSRRWNISADLVGGPDDFAIPWKDMYSSTNQEPGNNNADALDKHIKERIEKHAVMKDPKQSLKSQPIRGGPTCLAYSLVRHTSCVERVLIAAYGIDPKLDSAPKVWTTVAVAKYLGGKHQLLTDWVVRWLRTPPNTCFLEVMPEATLRIADALEVSSLCQDSFAILVGEEALASICQGHSVLCFEDDRTVFGRKKDDLPEAYQTRIEYASKQFKERILEQFEAFAGDEMKWVEEIPELRKLLNNGHVSRACGQSLNNLKDLLKAFVKGVIYFVLLSNFEIMPGPLPEFHSSDDESLFPTSPFLVTWSKLHYQARIFTRSFWTLLGCIHIQPDRDLNVATNFSIGFPDSYKASTRCISNDFKALEAAGTFRWVTNFQVENKIRKCFAKCSRSDVSDVVDPVATGSGTKTANQTPTNNIDNVEHADRPTHAHTDNGTEFLLPLRFRPTLSSQYIWKGDRADHSNDAWTTSADLPTQVQQSVSHVQQPIQNNASGTQWSQSPASDELSTEDFFCLRTFLQEVQQHLVNFSEAMLSGSSPDFDLQLANTLVCLNEEEKKYLPLWAEGLDDESGGVYNDDLPTAEMGFTAPGPKVHTGIGSTASSSEFEMVDRSDAGSFSHHTSTVVNDGISDINLDRRVVYDDSVFGDIMATKAAGFATPIGGEDRDMSVEEGSEWEVMTAGGGGGGGEASVAPPSLPLDKGKGKMVEVEEEPAEMYDDIFYEEGEEAEFSGSEDEEGEEEEEETMDTEEEDGELI